MPGAATARPGSPRTAYLAAGGAVLLWSTVATAFNLALRAVSPAGLLVTASLASTAALAAIVAATGAWRGYRGWSRGEWLRAALLGALNPFLYYLVLFAAYDRLPAQEAQPLNYAWPIVLVLFSAIFGRTHVRPATAGALAVSFCGVVAIATHGDPLSLRFADPAGTALALGSAFVWAAYWLLAARSPRPAAAQLLANFGFGSLCVVAYAALRNEIPPLTPAGTLGGIYVGLFEMGVTFLLWLRALRAAPHPATVGTLVTLAPFLSLVFIATVLGETIRPSSVAGLALIVAGIAVQKRVDARDAAPAGSEIPVAGDVPGPSGGRRIRRAG